MLVVAGFVVAFNNDDTQDLVASLDDTTTTSPDNAGGGVFVSTTTSLPPTTTTAARPKRMTTTEAVEPDELVCTQNTPAEPTPTPDDWATYWQTEPDPPENRALLIKICVDDRTPKVGQMIRLSILADDPDAKIGNGECDVHVTWESNSGSHCRDAVAVPDEPQPTPKPEHGRVTIAYSHAYDEPGEWIIDVSAWSGPDSPQRHPYASYNSIELRINVHR